MSGDYLACLENTQVQREAWWRQSIEEGTQKVFVALINEQVTGWISVGASRDEHAEPDSTGEVVGLYVLAEYWGTCTGRALWLKGTEYLLNQGFRWVTLWVLAENIRAVRFYRSLGLTSETASLRTLARSGRTLEEIRYKALL
jgi:ribosomal protein S18 acetylase RimI-like enzyme